MAAYSVLISLRQTLEDFIQSNPYHVFECRHGRELFESLQQNVICMQNFFDDHDHRHPQEVSKWEERIHDSCNEAESIIEDYIARTFRRKGEEILRKWLYCICECKKQSSLHSQIYRIRAMIDSIANEMESELGASEEGEDKNKDDYYPRSFSRMNEMPKNERLFGFEDYLKKIKTCILHDHSKKLQVISIVGMGGIGKTSLVKELFDDKSIVDEFDVRRWVKVSQSYDAKDILLAILGGENSTCDTNDDTNVIGYQVYKLLYHRRYLIVLDDIWESKEWENVKVHLPGTRSWVLLTTRNKNVGLCTKSSEFIYSLDPLPNETSWNLLNYKVFGEKDCPQELVEIGKKIAEGCHGLPLALVVIAGILVNVNHTRNSWGKIANDVSKVVETGDEKFLQVLALSYYHLPHYLRPCFLHMTFHKSLDIRNLVNSLTSDSFLNHHKNSTKYDAKEIVMGCLNELLDRNLITVTERKYNGKIMSFGIHGLIRTLITKICKEEKFYFIDSFVGAPEIISVTRRAHFHKNPQINSVKNLNLRTVLWCTNDILDILERCHHLKIIITTVIVPLNILSSDRLQLCHLKHLDIEVSKDEHMRVSSVISKLVNLNYLGIRSGWGGAFSSIDIWKLHRLRYFHAIIPAMLTPPPIVTTSSSFLNLQFLEGIANFRFTKDTPKLIPNVRKMTVHYREIYSAGSCSDYGFENLCHLSHLERLGLHFYSGDYDLMNRITFPSSLKSLLLRGGATNVTWEFITNNISKLPNLEKLRLRGHAVCGGNVWEINKGYFQKLQVLEVSNSCIKCWKIDDIDKVFPNLKRLILIACPALTDLPEGIEYISTLELILIDDRQEAIVNWAEEAEQFLEENEVKPFHVEVLKIAAELKKYEKKERKENEMCGEKECKEAEIPQEKENNHNIERETEVRNRVPLEQFFSNNEDWRFLELLFKIRRELLKCPEFKMGMSSEAFEVIAHGIIDELDKFENYNNVFQHQEAAIEVFRRRVSKISEGLKKYENEENMEEQKRCYHKEARMHFLLMEARVVEEMNKYATEGKMKQYVWNSKRRSYISDNEEDKGDEEEDAYLKMLTCLRHIYFDDHGSEQHGLFEEKQNKKYGEAFGLWVKFEKDRPDNGNKLLRVSFANIASDQHLELPQTGQSKIEVFWAKALTNVKSSRSDGDVPNNENVPFQGLIWRISVVLNDKYKLFELAESHESKIEVLLEMTRRTDAELDRFEKEKKDYKSFYVQETIELFQDMLVRINKVLKKYEEEGEESNGHQEVDELVRVMALRIVLELERIAKNAKDEEMYLKMHVYLRHEYFVNGNRGLYRHMVRSIECTHPQLADRLNNINVCPLDHKLKRLVNLSYIDLI